MKRVAMVIEFDSCFKCPYHSGGSSSGSALYCRFFEPPRQIFDYDGEGCKFEEDRNIANFCELPENEVFRYEV